MGRRSGRGGMAQGTRLHPFPCVPLRASMAGARIRRCPDVRHHRTRTTPLRTYSPKPADITRAWHIVDADGLVLGRLATEVATVLRGKHKAMFAPNVDTGDHV